MPTPHTTSNPAQGPAGAMPALLDEIDQLRAQLAQERAIKAELVAALEEVLTDTDGRHSSHIGQDRAHSTARAALSRAKEVQQ